MIEGTVELDKIRKAIRSGQKNRFFTEFNELWNKYMINKRKDAFLYYEILNGWGLDKLGTESWKETKVDVKNFYVVYELVDDLKYIMHSLTRKYSIGPSDYAYPLNGKRPDSPLIRTVIDNFGHLGNVYMDVTDKVIDIMKLLLSNPEHDNAPGFVTGYYKNINIDSCALDGKNALMQTFADEKIAALPCLMLAQWLINNKADVNALSKDGNNALLYMASREDFQDVPKWAVYERNYDGLYELVTQALIRKTVDLEWKNNEGQDAKLLAKGKLRDELYVDGKRRKIMLGEKTRRTFTERGRGLVE